jgi:hypothetical protein
MIYKELPKRGVKVISIDIGYGHTKVVTEVDNKVLEVKFPTAISFYTDNGITYGDNVVYEFEGEKYIVGTHAEGTETFSTTDYNIIHKFAPLIIYHILSKFEKAKQEMPVQVKTGLALVDWDKRDEFKERLKEFTVNEETIKTEPTIAPQGIGAYNVYKFNNPDTVNENITILDIGFNTINLINVDNNKPRPDRSKSYPGHGVSSIIKPFVSLLENKFKFSFSEQEAVGIMLKEKFTFNGEEREDIKDYIKAEKRKFIQKLFNSVLVNDKKVLGMSDKVIIVGGGTYMLENVKLPKNCIFLKKNENEKAYEYANARGYYLM